MSTNGKSRPHVAYYEFLEGLPLIVGPFPNYDTAWGYIDGTNVDEDLYDRAWAQPIYAPNVDAVITRPKLAGQCQAGACNQPGTERIEQGDGITLLCDDHAKPITD